MSSSLTTLLAGIKCEKSFTRLLNEKTENSNSSPAEYKILTIKNNQLISTSFRLDSFDTCALSCLDDTSKHIPSEVVDILKNYFNFTALTDTQKVAIPFSIACDKFTCIAKTGSGKTLAYILPIISLLLKEENKGKNALILAPTKDLVTQIYRMCTALVKPLPEINVASSSKSSEKTILNSRIFVSTPGYINSENLKCFAPWLYAVAILVMDEFDSLIVGDYDLQTKFITSSFINSVKKIWLYSASILGSAIDRIAEITCNGPLVKIGKGVEIPEQIHQEFIYVTNEKNKFVALNQLISDHKLIPPILVFVEDKHRCESVAKKISTLGIVTKAISSKYTTEQRQLILDNFRAGRIWCLVSTDVMARGIDCFGIKTILNFDIPQSRDCYIHRVGRTGRGDYKGSAITFYTEQDKMKLRIFRSILLKNNTELPDDIKSAPIIDLNDKKRFTKRPNINDSQVSSTKLVLKTKKNSKKFKNKQKPGNKLSKKQG